MLKWLGKLTDSNEKELKKIQPLVDKINGLEPKFTKLSDEELRGKTQEFKERVSGGETLDELLPEAFAAVREAARRTLGQRHYDVQLTGGIVLHQGKIAEMKTGEGKTLVATLPAYLNALSGKGVHVSTVNDYLARRDPYWMGPVYHALGVSVSSIFPMQSTDEPAPARLFDPSIPEELAEDEKWPHFKKIDRTEAYKADITYGTSSEFGFDYLRDNMVQEASRCVQRELNFSIVDEIDNLLIDEARTPLIISAPDAEATQLYQLFSHLVPRLKSGEDYEAKEKERSAELTDEGWAKMEELLAREGIMKGESLYDATNAHLVRHIRNALSAKEFYKRNHQYVVKDGEVIIVDEFTGRMMLGRRYSEGLHQAIEAKEGVKVRQESKTYATVTIQNYFRMYEKLAGMTGTAVTEAEEFHKIYELDVVIIPTHKPIARKDHGDLIYKDQNSKFKAVVNEIEEQRKQGRPVLVGTVAIDTSEHISKLLKKHGIKHNVLNAKQHESEAAIIARAGEPGAVTVATNMAGRGVDIILGGEKPEDENKQKEWQKKHDEVLSLGGLHVVGTERHESRRIDNQLRGRSGRQGDPGSSRFFVSLEDSLIRRFGGDRVKGIMEWAGMDESTPIENPIITKSVENAQKRVEGYHFDTRKHLVEFDDVINKHREVIYGERHKILSGADLKENILSMIKEEITSMCDYHLQGYDAMDWDLDGLVAALKGIMPLPTNVNKEALSKLSDEEVKEKLSKLAEDFYEQREKSVGSEQMRLLERIVMLHTIDNLWVEHLTNMDYVRQGIGLHAVAQRKPLDVYKRKGHELFSELLDTIKSTTSRTVLKANVIKREAPKPSATPMAKAAEGSMRSGGANKPVQSHAKKVGRNEPCPCGSGKKYKHCCGK